jgi:hypothetical protein
MPIGDEGGEDCVFHTRRGLQLDIGHGQAVVIEQTPHGLRGGEGFRLGAAQRGGFALQFADFVENPLALGVIHGGRVRVRVAWPGAALIGST